MTAILVDTNIHVIAPPELRSKYPLNIVKGTEAEFSEDQTNSPEGFQVRMAEAGLHQAYLMASRFHGFDNDYCAHALEVSPAGRFACVANIDILDEDEVPPDLPAEHRRTIAQALEQIVTNPRRLTKEIERETRDLL